LSCDEFLNDPIISEDQIISPKCTFSYVQLNAFDDVNISTPIAREYDYDNELNEVDASDVIESVEFANSRLPNLPRDIFVRFKNLKSLTCDEVNLSLLSKADFKLALNLEIFSCNSNYFKSLEKMLFNGSKKLKFVDLSINEIEAIDRTAFYGLENLKKLLLNDNKIRNLSDDVFEDLISLEEINLSSNQLKVVGEKLFENCNLLNYIYLNDNLLQKISDKSLLNINEIKFLELSNNELSNLRLNISASALYANQNRLKSVILKSVGYLSFYNNSISEISFDDKAGVISLNVSTNKISVEALKIFSNFNNIKSLDLSFNNLGTLNVSTFLNMPELQVLNLQSTNLSEIGFGLFTHQTKLDQLDLSYNNFNNLDLTKFSALKALSALFIEGNNISSFDYVNIKNILPALKLFGFSDNAWKCSYLASLISFLEQNEVEVYHLVVDKAKSNVAGIACMDSSKVSNEDKSPTVKHHQLSDGNESRAIGVILRHVNETSQKFVTKSELINELNMIKSVLASLKQDFLVAKKQNDKLNGKSAANESINQHNVYEQKMNELNLSISQSIDEIRDQLNHLSNDNKQLEAQHGKYQLSSFSSPPTASSGNDDLITKLMITFIFVIVCGFAIIYIIKLYANRRSRKFVVRRAYSETDTINENIL
jgi:hypothetical protein